jgi:hypothetical protein
VASGTIPTSPAAKHLERASRTPRVSAPDSVRPRLRIRI